MKKRIIPFLLVLVLAFSLLAGCGRTNEADDDASGAAAPDRRLRGVYYEDASGQVVQSTEYVYADGVLVREMDSQGESNLNTYSFTFDEQGRLTQKKWEGGSLQVSPDGHGDKDLTFTYDADGRVASRGFIGAIDTWQEETYAYDGELLSKIDRTWGAASESWTLSGKKDKDGVVTYTAHCTSNDAVHDVTYVYDADGRITQDYEGYWDSPVYYTYIDDPILTVRCQRYTASDGEEYRTTNACLTDTAGNLIDTIYLGFTDGLQLERDPDGYLVGAIPGPEDTWCTHVRLVYESIDGASAPAESTEAPAQPSEAPAQPSETPKQAAAGPLSAAETQALLSGLPETFVFSSGAGAWGTELHINADGTFTGAFHDSNMGETGDGYPHGTVYYSDFYGSFTDFRRVSDTVYTMRLKELHNEGTPGESHIENEIKYICSDPYGMDDADLFYLYLPGTPRSTLPEPFLSWVRLEDGAQSMPADLYGLYNEGGEEGFSGRKD